MEVHVAVITVIATVLVTELLGSDLPWRIEDSTIQYDTTPSPQNPTTVADTPSKPARRVCYYQSGVVYRPGNASYRIEDIPGDLCSHVIYAFSIVSDETWEMIPKKPSFDLDQGGYERFVGLKDTYPGLKTTISVGGWGDDGNKYSQLVSVAERRQTFVQSVVEFLYAYKFDGLDVDWEFPADPRRGGVPEDKDNFPLLLQELRTAFDAEGQGWELTVAVSSTASRVGTSYDVSLVCSAVDAVYLMTYNLRGAWNHYADGHSMLYTRPNLDSGNKIDMNVNGGVLLWESLGCPRNKIVIGVPFYGKTYTLCDPGINDLHAPIDGIGGPGPILKKSGVLMYFEICLLLQDDPTWVPRWDYGGLVPFAHSGNQWVGYEDKESLAIKMNYIREMGLLGAMNWAINDDDFRGLCGLGLNPLMRAIHDGLEDYSVPDN